MYPLIIFFCGVVFVITKGVKPRLYTNYIKKGRELEFSQSLGIDLEDVSQYPKAALEAYKEKKKYDSHI